MDNDDRKIIILSENSNPQDEHGRTPLHDFAVGKGAPDPMPLEYINATKDMIDILVKMGGRFDIKDNDGKSALDLALDHTPDVLVKIFIDYSLRENPNLAKPSSLAADLSGYWDTCKLASKQLNSQASTSNSSPAFFKAATPANAPTYKEEDEMQQINRHRLN
jgi:ankyrin repeat protein